MFCEWGVCVKGWVYMCIWVGWLECVRRVGMHWKEGEKRTTPFCHICYIKFISS